MRDCLCGSARLPPLLVCQRPSQTAGFWNFRVERPSRQSDWQTAQRELREETQLATRYRAPTHVEIVDDEAPVTRVRGFGCSHVRGFGCTCTVHRATIAAQFRTCASQPPNGARAGQAKAWHSNGGQAKTEASPAECVRAGLDPEVLAPTTPSPPAAAAEGDDRQDMVRLIEAGPRHELGFDRRAWRKHLPTQNYSKADRDQVLPREFLLLRLL